MKSISKLKDQARAHEQKENWQAAIEAYQKVLNALDDTETELDLSLYNRIGDLYYRVGQPDRAVHYYSQAAQKYAEMGLFNNAIALCNKALRYRPNDVNLFRMLGELSAEQGFLVEARRWYLQYAERQVQVGKVEEAFAALEEFAALADDPSVRETLADQFLAHERTQEALQQLERAYKERVARGEMAEASAVSERIRELDPAADVDALTQEGLAASADTEVPAPEDAGLVIESSAGSAGFRTPDPEVEQGAVEQPSGLETRPDDMAPEPEPDTAVSGLEVGYTEPDAAPVEPVEGLAGMETFDTGTDELETDETAAPPPETSFTDAPAEEASPSEEPSAERPLSADGAAELVSPDRVEEPAANDAPAADLSGTDTEGGVPAEASDEVALRPTLDMEFTAESEPASGVHEFADDEELPDDEEPQPLPLLDLGDGVQLEPEQGAAEPVDELVAEAVEGAAEGPVEEPADEVVEEPAQELVNEPVEELVYELPEPTDLSGELRDMESDIPPAVEGEGEEAAEPVPLLDLGEDALLGGPGVDASPEEEVAAFDLSAFDLTLAGPDESEERAAEPDVDTGAVLTRARELVGRELHDQALAELHLLLSPGLGYRVYQAALEVVHEMVRRNPDDFAALQRRVEFASRLGDQQVLAHAYADLAACMMRLGAETKAATVYQRVLELDPGNEAAREVLGAPASEDDSYVDLAAFLDEEGMDAALASGEANAQVEDFAELFSQFKAKVTEDVAVEESGSHYDLGLAFKEMGLIDEAIAEFQTALRGGEERLKVYEELGQCFMLKEQYTVAVKILARALELPREDPHELLGVYYHLGMCHEELGDRSAARQAYDNIMVIDPSFSDVPERLSRL
ncbi:MAG: tetratricopeptide repeat protein [Gemmatimonadota bacterium]